MHLTYVWTFDTSANVVQISSSDFCSTCSPIALYKLSTYIVWRQKNSILEDLCIKAKLCCMHVSPRFLYPWSVELHVNPQCHSNQSSFYISSLQIKPNEYITWAHSNQSNYIRLVILPYSVVYIQRQVASPPHWRGDWTRHQWHQ